MISKNEMETNFKNLWYMRKCFKNNLKDLDLSEFTHVGGPHSAPAVCHALVMGLLFRSSGRNHIRRVQGSHVISLKWKSSHWLLTVLRKGIEVSSRCSNKSWLCILLLYTLSRQPGSGKHLTLQSSNERKCNMIAWEKWTHKGMLATEMGRPILSQSPEGARSY